MSKEFQKECQKLCLKKSVSIQMIFKKICEQPATLHHQLGYISKCFLDLHNKYYSTILPRPNSMKQMFVIRIRITDHFE